MLNVTELVGMLAELHTQNATAQAMQIEILSGVNRLGILSILNEKMEEISRIQLRIEAQNQTIIVQNDKIRKHELANVIPPFRRSPKQHRFCTPLPA